MGSFKDSLKRMFIYSGPQEEETKESKEFESNDSSNEKEDKPRINLTNPLARIKDLKESASNRIAEITPKKISMSEYTRTLIYTGLFMAIEDKLNKGMPVEEGRLLLKRFLQDKITDESMYSETDLLYINTLVQYIHTLKDYQDTDDLVSLTNEIISNKYFLNIVETLDVRDSLSCMKYCIDHSYVLCGFSYIPQTGKQLAIPGFDKPTFELHINDSTFVLLKEVATLIKDEATIEDKIEYVKLKITPYFGTYLFTNNVKTSHLKVWLEVFNYASKATSSKDSKDVVNESVEDNIPEMKVKEQASTVKSVSSQKPVDSRFMELYLPMADPIDYSVNIDELKEAIDDIDESIKAGVSLSEEENHIYSILVKKFRTISIMREE